MSSRTVFGQLNPVGGGDPIPLLKPQIVIGRRSQCDVVLAFANVSAEHCQLELREGFWQVRDLGSRNGIKINGERCDSGWLRPGDELSIARHAFRIEYEAAGGHPPAQEGEDDDDVDPLAIGLLEKAGLTGGRARRRKGSGRGEAGGGEPRDPPDGGAP
jgi:adenylate cyclase